MLFNIPFIIGTFGGCGAAAWLFMWLAQKYGFQDHPNGRSSHGHSTVTGMGIIILIAFALYLWWPNSYQLPGNFVLGFFLLTIVSFIDDLYFLKHSVRLLFQVFAMIIMVYQLPFHSLGIEAFAIGGAAVLFGIGVINAYNFMDGINGMLTLNTYVVLGSMLFLNERLLDPQGNPIHFTDSLFIIAVLIPMAVFGFFNVRTRALAFIGDVGSIGIAFIILFLMYNLLLKTGNYTYLLLFSIFGVDAGMTVCYKLILRENIFVPHRDFIFKKLVHLGKIHHLKVTFYYFLVQLAINISIILLFPRPPKLSIQLSVLFVSVVAFLAVYIYLQSRFVRQKS